jgi:hypothetical protein
MPTPPSSSSQRPPRPRSASPAERSAEFAETQRRLKQEAADRRSEAAAKTVAPVDRASRP